MVIMERFALKRDGQDEVDPKTLGEVGEMVGLTKERVRQIQNRALEKLRIAMANRFAAA
jgi:DNA-directed RNA polymerase sigma subunit (sigma70/sigma32)